ncbi:MAG: flagellar biosynthetic protein FliR [Pseudomonadota bacterium]
MNETLLQLFSEWHLAGYVYTVFLVFVRVGATVATLPGFGEQFVSPRVKLILSLGLAVALQPIITTPLGDVPIFSDMLLQIGSEFFTGAMFGIWVRLIYQALSITAGFCAQVLGITNIFDASLEPGGAPALSGFLSFTALAVLSATGGHYFIFQAFAKTYNLVPFNTALDLGDASFSVIEAGLLAISLGLRMALPFLVIGFLINIGLGFVNRAMPQIPVFFVGQPLMIGVGFALLSLLMGTMMLNWSEEMRVFLIDRL